MAHPFVAMLFRASHVTPRRHAQHKKIAAVATKPQDATGMAYAYDMHDSVFSLSLRFVYYLIQGLC